jgi:hypothetical protein
MPIGGRGMNMEEAEKRFNRCIGCKHRMPLAAVPGDNNGSFLFYGCTHEPYKGKWVIEIGKCPLEVEK